MPPLLDAEVKPFEDAFLKGLCWSVFEIPPKSFDERRSMVTCAMSEMEDPCSRMTEIKMNQIHFVS
jgi:hypothetical protein